LRIGRGDALIVVDPQTDFCPGGALPVPGAQEIIAPVNRLIGEAVEAGAVVAASRDWHPADHISFRARGGPWPPHCIGGSEGAKFHRDIILPADALIISKGVERDADQCSALSQPETIAFLRQNGVRRLIVCGLALDVCVRATAIDAAAAGFETHLALGATRALTAEGARAAIRDMAAAGVIVEDG
jgi:nicotinamidase/pyrazinamidase